MSEKLVKDYKGDLIKKSAARKILGKYYEEGVTCFLMTDGQWYRITSTDKVIFDHAIKKHVLRSENRFIEGIINTKEEKGYFSIGYDEVMLRKKVASSRDGRGSFAEYSYCLNEDIASSLGYIESISDGNFYRKSDISSGDKSNWFEKKNIPGNERAKSYNLESDPDKKKQLIDAYTNLIVKPSKSAISIGKLIGDYTFGVEAEVINGFIPSRIRKKYGIKALKDGSLRHDGGEGIEYVTMPMSDAKGVEVIRKFTQELSKRCEVNNYCSVHIHFGNVRKDKIYVLSLYSLILKIQDEMQSYFPYSRLNSIKSDGKVYCKKLENLNINNDLILKSKNEEEFRTNVLKEFNKIYGWLNNGKELGEEYAERTVERTYKTTPEGKKMFSDAWLRNIYTVKSTYHSIQGNKWDKPQRYYWVNFLNLFFSPIHTVEFRIHEGSTNFTKVGCWMIICASILKFAEDVKLCMKPGKVNLADILKATGCSESLASYILEYMNLRHNTFYTNSGSYREGFKNIENKWFKDDPNFEFVHNNSQLI